VIHLGEALGGKDVSRSASEPENGLDRQVRVANLPEMVKPEPEVKKRERATTGLSGV